MTGDGHQAGKMEAHIGSKPARCITVAVDTTNPRHTKAGCDALIAVIVVDVVENKGGK
jgi:hypothetical protein